RSKALRHTGSTALGKTVTMRGTGVSGALYIGESITSSRAPAADRFWTVSTRTRVNAQRNPSLRLDQGRVRTRGRLLRPFRAKAFGRPLSPGRCPGRCPGLVSFSPSGWGRFLVFGLQGRHKPAQGNALGHRAAYLLSLP